MNTQGTGGASKGQKIQSPASSKSAESQAAKPTEPSMSNAAGGISRKGKDASSKKIPLSFDAAKPILTPPMPMEAGALAKAAESAVKKVENPAANLPKIQNQLKQDAKATETTAKELANEINNISTSSMSHTEKMLAITKVMYKIMGATNQSLANFLEYLSAEDLLASHRQQKLTAEQSKNIDKKGTADTVKMIFSYVGMGAMVLLSVAALAGATTGTAATAGAASPLVVATSMMLASSILAVAVQVSNDTGATKALTEQAIAPALESMGVEDAKIAAEIAFSVSIAILQIGLAVAGMVASGGASTATAAAQVKTAVDTINESIMTAQMVTAFISTAGGATAQGIIAYYDYEVASLESDKTAEEGLQSGLRYFQEILTDRLQGFIKQMNSFVKQVSRDINANTSTIGVITGNLKA